MSNIRDFPNIKPASRSYTPGSYPQVEFVAQNGAKSVLRYGNKPVDAKLTLGFTNITDSQANEILNLYDEVNSDYDYIQFSTTNSLTGIGNQALRREFAGKDSSNNTLLRYRFDGPPTVTSVRPNRSNVQCKFVACLDGD